MCIWLVLFLVFFFTHLLDFTSIWYMHRWHFNTFHHWFNMTNDFPMFASFSFRSYLPSCLSSRNPVFHMILDFLFSRIKMPLLPPQQTSTLRRISRNFPTSNIRVVCVYGSCMLEKCVVSLSFFPVWKVAMTCFPTRRIWNVWVFSSAWNIPIRWDLSKHPKLRWEWLDDLGVRFCNHDIIHGMIKTCISTYIYLHLSQIYIKMIYRSTKHR